MGLRQGRAAPRPDGKIAKHPMDSQRLLLFFVFSFSVFLLFDGWQRDQHPQQSMAPAGDKAGKGAPESSPVPAAGDKI